MNTRLAYVVFAFSFVVVIYVGLIRNGKDDLESKPVPMKAFELNRERDPARVSPRDVEPKAGKVEPKASPSAEPRAALRETGLNLEDFRKKYGPELRLEKDEAGRLIAILRSDAPRREDREPGSAFSPRNRLAAIARATEILSDARDLFGFDERMPLIHPQVSSTSHHAQVVFQQSIDGVPLAPSGTATVVLDRSGNLKALYSDYLRRTIVSNHPKLPKNQARHVLWVQSTIPVAQLKHAYETRENGFQIVVDAEDGRTLMRKNRRIY